MTPKDFNYAVDAEIERNNERVEIEKAHIQNGEYLSWLSGIYVMRAVACVLGGKKAQKYPDKPFTDHSDEISEIAKRNGKTEEEINQELILARFQIDEANARLEKQFGQTEE